MSRTENEVWRRLPDFPDYDVSNVGRVMRATPGRNTFVGRILKPSLNGDGYAKLGLRAYGVTHSVRVHILVARAFIGPRPEGMDVCHNDGDPSNNRATNLRYDTRSGNLADRIEHGRPYHGEHANAAKLTDANVREARTLRAQGETYPALALRYGVHPRTVRLAVIGKTWSHITLATAA